MKNKKIIALIAICVFVCAGCILFATKYSSAKIKIDPDKYYKVSYVVDGDTFKADIDGKEITVRMLGINTPETVDPRKQPECYGPEASKETKSLLATSSVRLALNPNYEEIDKYGRFLAYAWTDSGTFLNKYLLENGFAREYTFHKDKPYMYQKEFRALESEAKIAKVGLWGSCVTKS